MSRGSNKCASCGQFTSAHHTCPTPHTQWTGKTVPQQTSVTPATNTATRVATAREHLSANPRPRTEFMMSTMIGDILVDTADLDDEDTQYAYRNGQCLSLAYAFYKRGYDMAAIVNDPDNDDPVWDGVHYFAVHPEHKFPIDIGGLHTTVEGQKALIERFHGGQIVSLSEGQVRELIEEAEVTESVPPQCWDGGEVTAERIIRSAGLNQWERPDAPTPPPDINFVV